MDIKAKMEIIEELLNNTKDVLSDSEIKEYLEHREHDEKNQLLVEYKKYDFDNIYFLIYKLYEISNMLSENKIDSVQKELNILKTHFINEIMNLEYEE